MIHEPKRNSLLRNANIARAFRRWLCEDGDTLVASAELLGGRQCARRARAVVEAAREGGDLQSRRQDLSRLARLLRLEHVEDLSRPEAARLAALHLDDPRAVDAMYCADAVSRGHRALEALWLVGLPCSSEETA